MKAKQGGMPLHCVCTDKALITCLTLMCAPLHSLDLLTVQVSWLLSAYPNVWDFIHQHASQLNDDVCSEITGSIAIPIGYARTSITHNLLECISSVYYPGAVKICSFMANLHGHSALMHVLSKYKASADLLCIDVCTGKSTGNI